MLFGVKATSPSEMLDIISQVDSAGFDARLFKCDILCQIHAKWLVFGDKE